MGKERDNLRKTREEIIEVLKRNGVIITTRNYAMGTVIVLIDEKTGTTMTYNGGGIDVNEGDIY